MSTDNYSAAHRQLDEAVERAISDERGAPDWQTEHIAVPVQLPAEYRIMLTQYAAATARNGLLALHVFAPGTRGFTSFASNEKAKQHLPRLLAAAEEAVEVLRRVVEHERAEQERNATT